MFEALWATADHATYRNFVTQTCPAKLHWSRPFSMFILVMGASRVAHVIIFMMHDGAEYCRVAPKTSRAKMNWVTTQRHV